jgi:iron(III) transport system ATP-binding protein
MVFRCPYLNLKPGETLALLGASGTGKTTFFSGLAGHLESSRGQLSQNGEVVSRDWQLRKVARTLQSFPLLHWLTVEQNLKLAARLRNVALHDAEELLERVSARHLARRWPHTLSGGEKCRASLALCLVSDPAILLLDEPFNGLDVLMKKEVAETILEFVGKHHCAAVFVTHDLEDALEYSQRVAVIRRGAPSSLESVWDVREPDLKEKILAQLA